LKRAYETARLAAADRQINIVEDLREITYGEWDGLSWTQIASRWPQLAAAKLADWQAITPPGGEPWSEFVSRVETALADVLARQCNSAIIGHAGVNAIIAHQLAGVDPLSFKQPHAGQTTYEF
jgi:broad specificity phosphatase PhoE